MESNTGKVEKRNRPPVSCEPCRSRKLKCNRGLPCESCIKRNKTSLCHYAANAARGPPKRRDLKDRLNTLENLVSSLLSSDGNIRTGKRPDSRSDTETTATSSTRQVGKQSPPDVPENVLTPETPHLQQTEDGQVNYIDPSHWLSILEDIKEVRDHLSESRQQADFRGVSENASPDASFVFGSVPNMSFLVILESLPPRPVCDKLISWYFNSNTFLAGIVHPAKFQIEYEAFWESPATASPLWTALLFSILSVMVGMSNMTRNPSVPDNGVAPIHVLQQRAVQCLVVGKYATANAYALEAFMLHLFSLILCNSAVSYNDAWFEMGAVIRLAFRMGYHRDPKHLPGISVFDGEMRRRVWLNLVQVEALMSYQLGFPSMIPSEFCDTGVPLNLEYSDLQMNMTELPPGRPLSEQTTVRYTVAKHEVMAVFKKIAAHTQSLAAPTYNKTTALHKELTDAYEGLPEALKKRDINRSFVDSSALILQRCTIETLYLKGLIVLHRRYVQQSHITESSRQICIEAALDMLDRQADLYQACQPGGRLYEERWMIYCSPSHDFLLAAMVICLDLSVCMRTASESVSMELQQLRGREYRALKTSRDMWAANSANVPEAHLASLALDLMISKVAAEDFQSEFQYAGAMAQMIDGPETVDWALLDHYLQNLDGTEIDAIF